MKNKHFRRLLHLLAAVTVLMLLALPSVFADEATIIVDPDAGTITVPTGWSGTTDDIVAAENYNPAYTVVLSGGQITGGNETLPNQVNVAKSTRSILGGSFSGSVSVTGTWSVYGGNFSGTVTLSGHGALDGGEYSNTVVVTNLSYIGGTAHLTHEAKLDVSTASYFSIGGNAKIDCDVDLSATRTAYISGGTFNDWVTVGQNGRIIGGTFNAPVENNNLIEGGTFVSTVENNGTIKGGTFDNAVTNNGTIENGNFANLSKVTNNKKITGGNFAGYVKNPASGCTVTGGTFTESSYVEVWDYAKVSGGTFNGTVFVARAILSGGTVNGKLVLNTLAFTGDGVLVTKSATVSAAEGAQACGLGGGTFECEVTVNAPLTITGGTFNSTVTNNNLINGGTFNGETVNHRNITGGTFNQKVTNEADGKIARASYYNTDPIFNGNVINNGTIEGGKFSGQTTNNGTVSDGTFTNEGTVKNGTFSGNVINHGTIENGTFTDASTVTNERFNGKYGLIKGGTFDGAVVNSECKIVGGTFNGPLTIYHTSIDGGTVNGNVILKVLGYVAGNTTLTESATVTVDSSAICGIAGGTIECDVTVKSPMFITGGTFTGTVTNNNYILGGTFTGTVINNASGKIYTTDPANSYPNKAPELNCKVTNDGEIWATVYGENFELVGGNGKTYAVVTIWHRTKTKAAGQTVFTESKKLSYHDILLGANAQSALDSYATSNRKLCHWKNYKDNAETDLTENQTISTNPEENVFLQLDYINGWAQFRLGENGKYDLRVLAECNQAFVGQFDSAQIVLTFKVGNRNLTLSSDPVTNMYLTLTQFWANGYLETADEGYALTGLIVNGIGFGQASSVEAKIVFERDGSTVENYFGYIPLPDSADSQYFYTPNP